MRHKEKKGKSYLAREARWKRFHSWESRYERDQLTKLTPLEKIRLYEDLYQTLLKLRPEMLGCDWTSDEAGKQDHHLKHLAVLKRILK